MRKMSFRARFRLLIVLTLLLIALTTFAVGKYITTIEEESTVSFTANLAKDVILQEHKADRNADGSYTLTAEIATPDENGYYNSYKLIPGLDIKKDPHIIIQDKTPIPAYLYIEVESTLDTPVTYEIDDSIWYELAGVPGVYYYKDTIDENFSENPIYILKDNQITVGQLLLSQSDSAEDFLKFNVNLIEKVGTATVQEVYNRYQ